MNVGIVGGGQLARMLALAGYPLDLQFQILDPAADACAGQVATLIRGDYDAEAWLNSLADWADVVTFDFENVPAATARALEQRVAVYPPALASGLSAGAGVDRGTRSAVRKNPVLGAGHSDSGVRHRR